MMVPRTSYVLHRAEHLTVRIEQVGAGHRVGEVDAEARAVEGALALGDGTGHVRQERRFRLAHPGVRLVRAEARGFRRRALFRREARRTAERQDEWLLRMRGPRAEREGQRRADRARAHLESIHAERRGHASGAPVACAPRGGVARSA